MSDGLVHAFRITAGSKAERLDWQQVKAWQTGQGMLWLHLDVNDDQARRWVFDESAIPVVAARALFAPETRPRATQIGEGTLVQLRGVNLNPGADVEDMVSLRLWVEGDRMVSTRRRRLLSINDVVESLASEAPATLGRLFVLINDRLVGRISSVIDDIEERVADLEERALDMPSGEMRSGLSSLRREAIALRRYLAPQREALGRLNSEQLSWMNEGDRMGLREVTDRLVRLIEDLDAVRERAAVVQEEITNSLSDQLNRRMYVLSIVAAVFLPLGFLTGLLGINVGGIPGADNPWAFALFSGLLFALVGVQIWFFRTRRWF